MDESVSGAVDPQVLIHPADKALDAGPAVSAATLVHSAQLTTPNPAVLHWVNPGILPIFYVRPQPRANFHLPTLVSPNATPDDTLLYEDPQDGTHKFFLTAYGLGTTTVNGAQAKWVSFAPTGGGGVSARAPRSGWRLGIQLSVSRGR